MISQLVTWWLDLEGQVVYLAFDDPQLANDGLWRRVVLANLTVWLSCRW
jgi:hypothetical protein